jgi:hypothetical protein
MKHHDFLMQYKVHDKLNINYKREKDNKFKSSSVLLTIKPATIVFILINSSCNKTICFFVSSTSFLNSFVNSVLLQIDDTVHTNWYN